MNKDVNTGSTNIQTDVNTGSTNIQTDVSTGKTSQRVDVSTNSVLTYQEKINFEKDVGNNLIITIPSNVDGAVDYTALDNLQMEVKNYVRKNHIKVFLKLIHELEVTYKSELEEIMGIPHRDIEDINLECENKGFTIRASISDPKLNRKKELLLLGKVGIGRVKFIKLHQNMLNNPDLIKFKLDETITRNLKNRFEFLKTLDNELKQREREEYEKKKKKAQQELPLDFQLKKTIREYDYSGTQIFHNTFKTFIYRVTGKVMSDRRVKFFWKILSDDRYIIRVPNEDGSNIQYFLNVPDTENELEKKEKEQYEKEFENVFSGDVIDENTEDE